MAKSRRFSPIASVIAGAALVVGGMTAPAPTSPVPTQNVQQDGTAVVRQTRSERAPAPQATSSRIQRLADVGGGFVREVRRWEPIWVGRPRQRRMLHTRFARG